MNKNALTKLVDDCLSDWESAIAELGPDGLEKPGACGDWRVRDVLAHVVGWDRWQIAQLRSAFTKIEPTSADLVGDIQYGPEMDAVVTADERNAVFYKTHKDRPLDTIVKEWRDVSATQVEWIAGATQDQLDAKVGVRFSDRPQALYLISEVPEAAQARPAADWIKEQMDHRREHLDEVHAWMAKES